MCFDCSVFKLCATPVRVVIGVPKEPRKVHVTFELLHVSHDIMKCEPCRSGHTSFKASIGSSVPSLEAFFLSSRALSSFDHITHITYKPYIVSAFSLLVVFALGVVGQALTPSTFFTNVDKERLRYVFNAVKPYGEDLEAMHYSIMGISLLGKHFEEPYVSA